MTYIQKSTQIISEQLDKFSERKLPLHSQYPDQEIEHYHNPRSLSRPPASHDLPLP